MRNHGPWKIKSSEVKYKNPWLEVIEDKVIRPDGKDGIYSVIRLKSGISVLPIDDQDHVYLNAEFKYVLGKESIETMSGGIEAGEEPIEAAKRELQEEYGMIAKEYIDLGVVNAFTAYVDSPARMFLARELSNSWAQHEATETLKIIKLPLRQAVGMVMESKITHSQSCTLILKAAKYLGKL